jgi:cytosine/adenosine deaminase-related metal-dependent hydrolase
MIITTSKIIHFGSDARPIGQDAILIKRDVIQAVGSLQDLKKRYPGNRVLRLQNAILIPGLVNTHTHLELPSVLKIISAKTFPDWVLNLILLKRQLKEKNYLAAVKANIKSLRETGTTTVGEICTHRVSPKLLKQSRLRATVFYEVISLSPLSLTSIPGSLVRRPLSLASFGISPHSPYTVSQKALRQIKKISDRNNVPFCMHIAESKDEIMLLQRKKSGLEKLYQFAKWDPAWAPAGASSFDYLNRIGFLSPNLLAVHAVQVNDRDIALIRKSRATIAHCPRSNHETHVGRMPLKKFLDAGITVGLGTDSLASSPSLSMWDEMRYALKIHKKDGITAGDILALATTGGAKALGLDMEIGTLEPGKKADLIAVPLPSKNTGDIYSDLIRETKSCIMTMVNGKIIWTDKRFRIHDSR